MASKLLEQIDAVRFNPSAIQRVILDTLEEKLNGEIDIVDPTNPFVFLLEASAVNASAAMSQSEALTRRQYPSLAQTEDELYLHMADADYIGRFATPSRTSFTLLFGIDELYQRAVSTGVGTVRKLVIPRHTEFQISGYKFTLQYPIEIRIMSHGGLQAVYDVDKPSPLQTLESNLVDWMIVEISKTKFIKLDVPVQQFEITPHYDQLNPSTGFNKNYAYADQFYYCRVYISQPDGSWQEIRTTHTDQVYDPKKVTAVLKVKQGVLNVQIPQIYFTTGLANREVRVDIYTTKGRLDLVLGNYSIGSFVVTWRDLDDDDRGVFSAPLSSYSTMAVFSDKVVSGGTPGITFEELRERVMRNTLGSYNLPITGAQLETTLENMGYEVVKDVDNITKRIYLATRSLPSPTDGTVSTGAGCTIGTLQTSMEKLKMLDTVKDNGNRITILPTTLFERVDGVIKIVPKSRVDAISGLSLEAKSNEINTHDYLYTPFHYVLDATNNNFSCRPYFFERPNVEAKMFVRENDTAELEVSTESYTITKTDHGYLLRIVTSSGESFKGLDDEQIHVQLAFKPVGEVDYAYLNGVMVGKVNDERVYEFDITTNYDVDSRHSLLLTSFKMYDDAERSVPASLVTDFEIIYSVTDHEAPDMQRSEIDNIVGSFIIDADDPVGIINERLRVRLGNSLTGLWSKSRSVASSLEYERYETDEPWVFEYNVYKRDPVTGALEINYDPDTQEISYTLIHAAGDPVLDENGDPLYRHRAGDVRLDTNGDPIIKSGRTVERQVDLLFLDGVYLFATEENAIEYRETIAQTIVSWVTEDIAAISQNLLEQTQMFFYPKRTIGDIDVYINNGIVAVIPSGQSFRVKYFMSRNSFDSLELRAPLTKIAIDTIAESLKNKTISLTDIGAKISAVAGGDILGVEVYGLGGDRNLSTLTVKDQSSNCTIRKRLQAQPDGTLAVRDDVTVEFVRHIA